MKDGKRKLENNLSKAKNAVTKFIKLTAGEPDDAPLPSSGRSSGVDRKTARRLKRQKVKENKRAFQLQRSSSHPQGAPKKKVDSKNLNLEENSRNSKKKSQRMGKEVKRASVPPEPPVVDEGKLIDDADVKRLSKKLKIKPGKVPKSFYEDGDLGALLELCELKFDHEGLVDFNEIENADELLGVETADDDVKVSVSDSEIDSDLCSSDEETRPKRPTGPGRKEKLRTSGAEPNENKFETSDKSLDGESDSEEFDESVEDDFSEGSSEKSSEILKQPTQMIPKGIHKENSTKSIDKPKFDPYAGASKFYVPPQKRSESADNSAKRQKDFDSMVTSEDFPRIYKQCVGLFNRVSETNLQAISKLLELVYSKFATSEVNIAVSKAVMNLCCLTSAVSDRLIFEKIALVAIVHKITQTDLASQFVHSVTWKWKDFWENRSMNRDSEALVSDKTGVNSIKCLCYLYNFSVLSHTLIFDVIKKLLSPFDMSSIDSLTAVVLNTGPFLRKSSPSDLKDIILAILKTGNEHLKSLGELERPRLEHFLDLVTALKNNNRRKLESVVNLDALSDIQEVVKGLSSKSITDGGSLISISLLEIVEAGATGRWWNLGTNQLTALSNESGAQKFSTNENEALIQLAQSCGMNTPFRESVFCAIMTSSDYVEAANKLFKVNLKKHAREIPHIAIKCLLLEERYNPFYFHLLKSFANYDKQNKVVLKFAIADRLKDLKMMKNKTELAVFAELLVCLIKEPNLVPPSVLSLLPIVNLSPIASKFIAQFLRKMLFLSKKDLNQFVERLANDDCNQVLFNLQVLMKQQIIEKLSKMSEPNDIQIRLIASADYFCSCVENVR